MSSPDELNEAAGPKKRLLTFKKYVYPKPFDYI
jgi:hypothetical protein